MNLPQFLFVCTFSRHFRRTYAYMALTRKKKRVKERGKSAHEERKPNSELVRAYSLYRYDDDDGDDYRCH